MKTFKIHRQKISFWIIGLIILFFLLNFWGGGVVKEDVFLLSSPLLNAGNASGNYLSHFFLFLSTNKQNLENQNQELRSRVNNLLSFKSQWQEVQEENNLLRKALSLQESKGLKTFPAYLVARNLNQGWILINKGSKDNVAVGQAVITPQQILVGQIKEVFPHQAKVKLISDPRISIDAEILGSSPDIIRGLVKGQGNNVLIFTLIPLEKKINIGQTVIVSHLNSEYPAGLIIGKIEKVNKENTKAFQAVFVKPSFRQQALGNLLIVRKFSNQ